MSGGPFRELFVELPAQLIEALRAAAELKLEADRQLPPRHEVRGRAAKLDFFMRGHEMQRRICLTFGHTDLVCWRAQYKCSVLIQCRRPCGYREHTVVIDIDDHSLEASENWPAYVIDRIKRASASACCCVRR